VVFNPIFDSVLDVEWIVGVSWIVRSDRHDPDGQQVVVPVEDILGTVSNHPDRVLDGAVGDSGEE
jgi:hypothetical protein